MFAATIYWWKCIPSIFWWKLSFCQLKSLSTRNLYPIRETNDYWITLTTHKKGLFYLITSTNDELIAAKTFFASFSLSNKIYMLLGFVELDFFAPDWEERSLAKESRSFKVIYFLYLFQDISVSYSKTKSISICSRVIAYKMKNTIYIYQRGRGICI